MEYSAYTSTAPTVEPLTIDEAKDYAKIEVNDDDKLIRSLIKSSRIYAENYTRRALLTQTVTMNVDWGFPCEIMLPVGPSQSVTSVSYVDTNGDSQTLSGSTYTADTDFDPGRIYLAYNQTWPTVRCQRKTITVVYQAGYGDASTDVPEQILTAIKMMVVHQYENRQPHVLTVGGVLVSVPDTVNDLLLPYVAVQ